MALIDHSYGQFIDAYRVNFKNWRIVDIDNYMNGNSLFLQVKEEAVWNQDVVEKIGDGVGVLGAGDPKYDPKSPHYQENL